MPNLLSRILSAALSLCALLLSPSAHAEVQTTNVFSINEGGSKYYRIPALCNTANGNLIAIADQRGASASDITPNSSPIRLVAKISRDNGLTWGELFPLFPDWKDENGAPISHGDAAVALYPRTGDLVCVFAARQSYHTTDTDNPGQIYVSTSKDNGLTWGTPLRIDHQLSTQINAYNEAHGSSRRFFTGFAASGNMMVTPSAIAFVMNARHSDERTNTGKGYEYVCALLEDDYANMKWTVLNPGSPVCSDGSGNESKMADLSDDRVIMSIRTNGRHRFSYSDDRGATWGELFTASTDGEGFDPVEEPGCNGGYVRHNSGSVDRLLLSLPARNVSGVRNDVTIYYSDDAGIHWRKGMQLINGPSGYSALRVLAGGNVGALVERGNDTDGYDIQFFNIPMSDLVSQGLHENFTGTLACNGQGYLSIPNSYSGNPADSPFSVTDFRQGMTFTTRVFITQYGVARGIVATRWHPDNILTRTYQNTSGFAIYGGWLADNCLGANVTLANTNRNSNPPVLDHQPIQNVMEVGKSSHVALTIREDENGELLSQVYVDGVMVDDGAVKNADKNLYTSPYQLLARADILLGCRYNLNVRTLTTAKCEPNQNDIWLGDLDDVRFYNRSMAPEEIVRDMNSGFPILTRDEGLIAAYDFSAEDAEGNYTDISGNGHNARKVTVNDYTFPELDSEAVRISPVSDSSQGVFHIKEFTGGYENDLFHSTENPVESFPVSMGKDLYACAIAREGYELVGIYVNGFPLVLQSSPDGGLGAFFKANAESVTVWAKFRKKDEPLNFYLSGDFNNNEPTDADKFMYVGDNIYKLKYTGKRLDGFFHIREIADEALSAGAPSARAAGDETISLYSSLEHRENGGDTSVAMKSEQLYNVQNPRWTDVRLDFNLANPDEPFLRYNPSFILEYNPLGGVRTFKVEKSTVVSDLDDLSPDIISESAGPVRYYNLQGQELPAPPSRPGIYIRRDGDRCVKTLVR